MKDAEILITKSAQRKTVLIDDLSNADDGDDAWDLSPVNYRC